jgi:hypothetical protein
MPQITVTLKNTDNEPLFVEWDQCKVKVKGGTYKALSNNTNTDTIAIGGTVSTVYSATFATGARRRYQIAVSNGDSDNNIYYPSSSTWTIDDTPEISVKV